MTTTGAARRRYRVVTTFATMRGIDTVTQTVEATSESEASEIAALRGSRGHMRAFSIGTLSVTDIGSGSPESTVRFHS
jgi:hypothetical protein